MEYAEIPIDEAIEKLGSGIKRLKIDFDRYLSGTLERPPTLLQRQVEGFIRYYRNAPPKSFHHRFQINSLISRYNMLRELWGRQVRNREMGIQRAHLRLGTISAEETDPLGRRPVTGNGNGLGNGDGAEIESLYREFSALHLKHRGKPTRVPLEAFAERIRRAREDIRKKAGCESVDFQFTVDDNHHIRLKAKPAK